MLIETQINKIAGEDDETNPDPCKYIDRNTLSLLYEVLNVKLTHGISFQSFFDLMQLVSEDLGLICIDSEDDYLHVDVLDIFCKHFIRGFSRLIVDLGFDDILVDDVQL